MKVLRAGSIVLCLILLGACGFRPLYATTGKTGTVAAQLASVTIPAPDTRVGQIIRNDLLSAMRPAGQAGDDRYVLTLKPVVKNSDIIETSQPLAGRQSLTVSVDFQLFEGKTVRYSGKTFSQVSYDVIREPFADAQALSNAQDRAAHELGADIRTRLASFFATH